MGRRINSVPATDMCSDDSTLLVLGKHTYGSRVMNKHSEELWDNLNEKAGGDTEEFQKAHDELLGGVKECLALFFDPAKAEGEEKEEDAKKDDN